MVTATAAASNNNNAAAASSASLLQPRREIHSLCNLFEESFYCLLCMLSVSAIFHQVRSLRAHGLWRHYNRIDDSFLPVDYPWTRYCGWVVGFFFWFFYQSRFKYWGYIFSNQRHTLLCDLPGEKRIGPL